MNLRECKSGEGNKIADTEEYSRGATARVHTRRRGRLARTMERTNVKVRKRERAAFRHTRVRKSRGRRSRRLSPPQAAHTTRHSRLLIAPTGAVVGAPVFLQTARQDLTQLSRAYPSSCRYVELSQGGGHEGVYDTRRDKTLSRTDQQTARNEPLGARHPFGVSPQTRRRVHPTLQSRSAGHNRWKQRSSSPTLAVARRCERHLVCQTAAKQNEVLAFVMK
ncbi:hypothetical protein MRX96_014346 [Rhipicephalus microplus]